MDQQETERKELKKSLAELKQGIISLSAMLNKHGEAELWFGISPMGEALGLDISEKTLRDISQAIAAHVEPAIYPSITQQIIDDKPCIKVEVLGQQQPYFSYGRAYMRVADEDKRLSAQELKQLILYKHSESIRWETEPSKFSVNQLNQNKIKDFLQHAGLPEDTIENALEKLDLLKDGQLVKAAELFFTEQPIELRCAVFATTDSGSIIDMKDFFGDILELIEEAEKFILKNIHVGMQLDGLYRVDVPEIAVEALREAIINAFCHRDWRDPDNVQVAIFKDRVEIRSPGELYGNLSIEQIMQGNVSRRRNPLIANLLRRIHLVEAWARGMPKILSNAPNTSFKEFGGLFITSFGRKNSSNELSDKGITMEVTMDENTEVAMEVSAEIKAFLAVFSGDMSRVELMNKLALKNAEHFRLHYLRRALEGGLIEMTLPDKPQSRLQKYRLTEVAKQLLRQATNE
ncbi:MAG: AAA family ATPase [Alcaligenaceae bacterium]|nr:AAA family ATPase [Alcaligenaceae bacterium]